MRAHALARLYPYLYIETLSYRFSEDGRLLSYCHRRSKKIGLSEATVLLFKNQIGDGYYYRPLWRYSIASEKITIEFDVPTISYYTTRVY